MNIIQVVTNKVWGGGERYVLDLSKRLRSDGHNVVVAARRGCTGAIEPFIEAALSVHEIPFGGFLDIVTPKRLAALIDACDGPVAVHVHNFKDAAVALKARRRINRSDVRVICTRHLCRPAKARHEKIYNSLDAIVFVSQFAQSTFLSSSPAVDPQRLHTVRNALTPMPRHTPAPAHRAGEVVRLCFMGRLDPEKGLGTLIEAVGLLPAGTATVDVYGSGEKTYVAQLRKKADRLAPGTFVWHGYTADVYAALESSQALVAPSSVPEACGFSIMEAMAAGRAVIVSDNGAQPELLTDGKEGFLLPPDNPVALAGAIARLADSDTLIADMGGHAAATAAASFSYDTFYNKIISIYNNDSAN